MRSLVIGDKDEEEFMLLRAQADAELAMVLSLQDGDKKDAARAIRRFQQLRDDANAKESREDVWKRERNAVEEPAALLHFD